MKLRRIVSLTTALPFLVMLLSSLQLYVAPQGRVAYWSDWRFWGLDKTQWGNILMNVGEILAELEARSIKSVQRHEHQGHCRSEWNESAGRL